MDEMPEDWICRGYQICVFPDAPDQGPDIDIGYMPGKLPWLVESA